MNINFRENSAWNIEPNKINNNFIEANSFSKWINFKIYLVYKDYNYILINSNPQITMNRTSFDINAISLFKADSKSENDNTILSKFNDVNVNISKIIWQTIMVKVIDKEKITILQVINSHKPIICMFRT